MPETVHRGGVIPESKPGKISKAPPGPRVFKGGMVPSTVLEDSKPSSPPEVLANPVTKQAIQVQQMRDSGTPPSPPPVDPDPYSGWNLLGLKTDTNDPSRQWETRSHPVTGEVVEIPVGKAAATPTLGPGSLLPEAGLPAPSPAPASVALEGIPVADTTAADTTMLRNV